MARAGFSSSNVAIKEALRANLYENILDLIGTTGFIIPLGDEKHGALSGSTVKTVGDVQLTFTASSAFTSWTTPPGFQGLVPVLTWDGSNDELDTPDSPVWTRDDASSEAWSMRWWVNVTDTANVRQLCNKNTTSQREYSIIVGTDDKMQVRLIDNSTNQNADRDSDNAITMGEFIQLGFSYDGAGGASAANTIILYQNGAVLASGATTSGTYVAMEDKTDVFGLGQAGGVSLFQGKMAGGPLGPWRTHVVVTADAFLRDFELGRRALAL